MSLSGFENHCWPQLCPVVVFVNDVASAEGKEVSRYRKRGRPYDIFIRRGQAHILSYRGVGQFPERKNVDTKTL